MACQRHQNTRVSASRRCSAHGVSKKADGNGSSLVSSSAMSRTGYALPSC